MRAWVMPELSGIEKIELRDIAEPTASDGELLLDVRLAALNPADYYLAAKQYPARPALPHVLGRDGLGTSGGKKYIVLRSEIGVTRQGLLAEKCAVPTESLVDVPAGWSDEEAAAAPLVYLTAWQALHDWATLPKDATVLVSGASGGVGVASVQLAAALGHRVIALSRSELKRAELIKLGAAETIDATADDWVKRVKAIGNVDLAIDNIGGDTFPKLIDTLAAAPAPRTPAREAC